MQKNLPTLTGFSEILFVAKFLHFVKKNKILRILSNKFLFFKKKKKKKGVRKKKKSKKFVTIVYNIKGCLRFSTFMFLISPNLAKYTYGRSALEQYHKIEKRKKHRFHPTKYYTMDNPCFPHIRLPSMSLSLYKNKILTFLSYFSQSLVEMKRLFCFERSQRRDSIPFS
jgi:hypothetical protein